MATQIKKVYNAFAGENLRSPEILRNQSTSTESLNVQQTDNLGMGKRKGHQIQNSGQGGSGAVTFNKTDITSGTQTQERLVVDENLYREITNTITLAYSGTGSAAYSYLLNSDQVFELHLYVDGEVVASQTFGNGRTASEVGTSAVVSFINGVTDWSATDNGSGSNRAAFISVNEFRTIDTDLVYKTFEQVDNPGTVTNIFPLHWASRNDDDYELMQFAQTNDVLYITNGKDGLFKYDGLRVYKAGMPDTTPLTLNTGAGALTGSYLYRYFYEYTDAQGRSYRSNVSSAQEIELSSNDVDITIPTIKEDSGYDTSDFLPTDTPTGDRIKITILRTRAGGTVFYEVTTIDNDPSVSSIVYTDNAEDDTINVDFTLPANNPRQPPICRYIDVFRNKLILTGNAESVNEVYFSDIESPEGFPIANRFIVRSRFGGPNSAVESQDNFLYIFKPNSISVVTGSLDSLQFEVDILSDEGVGCISANSIIKSQGKIYFLSSQGIYSIFNSQTPQEESSAHKPYYNNPTFNELRVNGINWIKERLLIWSLPEFDTIDGEKVLNKSRSKLVTLDIENDSWRTWKGLDISSGVSLDEEDIWFTGRFEDTGNTVRTVTSQLLNLGTGNDYADHDLPIEWRNATHWEHVEEPAIDKNFTRMRVYSVGEPLQNFTITGFDLTVKSNFNYSTAVITEASKSFVGGSQGYGEGAWDSFPWGDTPFKALQYNLSRKKCKSMRLIFENNTLHQNVLVTGYEIEVWAPYRPAIKGGI